jgi:hypothetical protein
MNSGSLIGVHKTLDSKHLQRTPKGSAGISTEENSAALIGEQVSAATLGTRLIRCSYSTGSIFQDELLLLPLKVSGVIKPTKGPLRR